MKVLFLCTGNSCRSQMAEGWARHLHGDELSASSAGVIAKGLDPRAVRAMAEAGVDISTQTSKALAAIDRTRLDWVVTVCGNARATCPAFPGPTRVMHHGFDDPPHLARDVDDEEAAMTHYRRVRDEIRAFVERLPATLREGGDPT